MSKCSVALEQVPSPLVSHRLVVGTTMTIVLVSASRPSTMTPGARRYAGVPVLQLLAAVAETSFWLKLSQPKFTHPWAACTMSLGARSYVGVAYNVVIATVFIFLSCWLFTSIQGLLENNHPWTTCTMTPGAPHYAGVFFLQLEGRIISAVGVNWL